ncbi:MAG TPA: nucleoside transporter C-terminal domain-containing protein [Thermoanaerobaculia bacterium]|jgi:CNT family concentrative nucleoside transporter|nr:nucleoside transporter C-terminal domain-containing protein [Thermoanaerobaculia bacterium]
MERFSALIGFVGILAIAFLLSNNRKAIRWKTVFWGLSLQILTAIAVLKGTQIAHGFGTFMPAITQWTAALIFIVLTVIVVQVAKRMEQGGGRKGIWSVYLVITGVLFLAYNLLAFLFENLKDVVTELISYTAEGSKFVFGPLGDPANTSIGFVFATRVLPTIIFIASVFAVLYYLGVMQIVVRFFAKMMSRFMGASGAESLSVAASIFMGQTEAPLTIRPFLDDMTMSELMTIMTAGMAHVSGAIMAAYVLVAKVDVIHLLTAVIMTAPGAIMMAKMIVPETEKPKTGADVEVIVPKQDVNVIDAAGRGAIEGLHLSLNVAGMLIAFIALVALVNGVFGYAHNLAAHYKLVWGSTGVLHLRDVIPASLDVVLGWIFRPIAWAMGVSWKDSLTVGNLLGTRMVLNEFVAFAKLGQPGVGSSLNPRSFVIVTYALCGFANFSSIAIQIGGIGSLAPSRRGDLARLGMRAMLAGTLANFLTATIAGMLL